MNVGASSAFAETVKVEGGLLRGAVEDGNDYSTPAKQSAEPQLLDLKRIVLEDEQMLRQLIGKNIDLKTDLKSSVGLVRADAGYIHQVLLNLTVNARDAMPDGGRLLITLSNSDIGETLHHG